MCHIVVSWLTQVSVVPLTKADRKCYQTGVTLQAANGASIATFGQRSLTLNLGLRRPFRWIFTIADVKHPIVGLISWDITLS